MYLLGKEKNLEMYHFVFIMVSMLFRTVINENKWKYIPDDTGCGVSSELTHRPDDHLK